MSGVFFSHILNGARPSSWSLTEGLNRGWNAQLGFGRWRDTRFSAESHMTMTLTDRRNVSLISPPMLAEERGRVHNNTRTTGTTWMDRSSWRLSNGSESFDTFLSGTTADICAAVADRFDVPLFSPPSLPIYKEDFKLVNGWHLVTRIARAAGKVITVDDDGGITFRNHDWTTSGSSFRPSKRAGGVREGYRPLARYDRLFVTKTTGVGTFAGPWYFDFTAPGNVKEELPAPLGPGAYPTPEGGVGTVAWVTLWDDDPDTGGESLGTWQFTGVIGDVIVPDEHSGTWPAKFVTAVVYPDITGASGPTNTRLRINGTPHTDLPPGIDPAISETFGTGRGAPSPYSDSLIPSLAHATATWPAWMQEANRGTNILTASGPLDCSVRVGQTWGWPPWGLEGRIEQVTHRSGRVPITDIFVNCDVTWGG